MLRVLRRRGTLTADEAGQIVHAGRGKHPVDETCAFCGVDGRPILQTLVAKRLAERGAEGAIQLPRTPATVAGPRDLPEGF